MPRITRAAALAAAAALALAASACATRQTATDSQTAFPSATQPGSAPSRPGDSAVTARSLPSDPSAPRSAPDAPGASQPGAATWSQPGAPVPLGGPGGAAVALSDVYFGFDESTLSTDARRTLDRNAEYLRRQAAVRVQIEGHADERGSTAYNLALGDRRASAAKRYLESLGVDASRLSTISFGEERPFVVGSSEDAWSQNRRGHFVEVR